MPPLKVAVLGGGGAMGGLLGGYLSRAGEDVTLIDVRQDAVEAINSHGLSIREADGSESRIAIRAVSEPGDVGVVDFILSVVKSYHTAQAIRSAAPLMGTQTVVVSLQNGWGNADRIGDIVGRDRVLVGLTYHSATLVEVGEVRHTGAGKTYIGELDGSASERLATVTRAFIDAGMEVETSSTIVAEIWKKLALNVCTLPTSALLHFQAHELTRHEGTRALMRGLLAEVAAVAKAGSISLDEDERWDAITNLLDRAVGGRSSMLQDVEAGRRTEIDVINGAISDAGRRSGIATPLNDAMVSLVTALQEKYLATADPPASKPSAAASASS